MCSTLRRSPQLAVSRRVHAGSRVGTSGTRRRAARPERLPASPAQERLLILDRLGETGVAYNYPLVFRVRGPLDLDALRDAVGDVVDRHESLRTVFGEDDGGFHQRVLPDRHPRTATVVDCDEPRLADQIATATGHRFDLEFRDPVAGQRVPNGPRRFHGGAAAAPHRDRRMVGRAVHRRSQPRLRGHGSPASPLRCLRCRCSTPTTHCGNANCWRACRSSTCSSGATRMAGAPDELSLPTDRPRPAQPTGSGGTLQVDLPLGRRCGTSAPWPASVR